MAKRKAQASRDEGTLMVRVPTGPQKGRGKSQCPRDKAKESVMTIALTLRRKFLDA